MFTAIETVRLLPPLLIIRKDGTSSPWPSQGAPPSDLDSDRGELDSLCSESRVLLSQVVRKK